MKGNFIQLAHIKTGVIIHLYVLDARLIVENDICTEVYLERWQAAMIDYMFKKRPKPVQISLLNELCNAPDNAVSILEQTLLECGISKFLAYKRNSCTIYKDWVPPKNTQHHKQDKMIMEHL